MRDSDTQESGTHESERRRNTRVFLLAVFLHGLAYLLLLPPWMGEDEPWQYEYLHHVAEGRMPQFGQGVALTQKDIERAPFSQLQVQRRFPAVSLEEVAETQRAILSSMEATHFFDRVDWTDRIGRADNFEQISPAFTATNQPQLYYLVVGTWVRSFFFVDDLVARLYLARLFSLACHVAVAACALFAARAAFGSETFALATGALVAWLPMLARQAALVNNDVLAKLFASVVFLIAVRRVTGLGSKRELSLMLGCCVLGVLTKTTAAGAIAVALVACVSHKRTGLLVGAGLLALVAVALWFWTSQHNPGIPRNVEAFRLRLERGVSLQSRLELWRTSVGVFNWYSRNLPGQVYMWVGRPAAFLALFSVAVFLRRDCHKARWPLALAWTALVVQVALVALRGVSAARYVTPAALGLGLVLAAGCLAPLPQRARPFAVLVLVAALLVYDTVFLFGGLLPHQVLLWRA